MHVFAGLDSCMENGKYKEQYKTDKRCYITDEQRKTQPYNAVVGILTTNDTIKCTGTVVNKNGKLYVYTAKHCIINQSNIPQNQIRVKTQTGQIFTATEYNVGNFYREDLVIKDNQRSEPAHHISGDWAIYTLDDTNLPSVELTDKLKIKIKDNTLHYDARIVGYGSLKIMNDKEIKDFKQQYIDYLKTHNKVVLNKDNQKTYGFVDKGINTTNDFVYNFMVFLNKSKRDYYEDMFKNNDMLKVSRCAYTSDGKYHNCQIWGGGSGGAVFDNKDNLMAIHTRGHAYIGGDLHADGVGSINLQEKPIEKVTNKITDWWNGSK